MAYINTKTFDVKKIQFGAPQPVKDVPGSFKVSVQSEGEPLAFLTPWLFTFGVGENLNYNDKTTVEGYSLPLCMTDMEAPTQEQLDLIRVINDISAAAQEYLLSVKKTMKRFKMDAGDFKKFNPLYYKLDEDGNVVQDRGPTLYVKLRCFKDKKNKNKDAPLEIQSEFYEGNSREKTDPLKFMGVRGKVRCLFTIDSIFVGTTAIRLQIRLAQAAFKTQSAKGRAIPQEEEDEEEEYTQEEETEEPQNVVIESNAPESPPKGESIEPKKRVGRKKL